MYATIAKKMGLQTWELERTRERLEEREEESNVTLFQLKTY